MTKTAGGKGTAHDATVRTDDSGTGDDGSPRYQEHVQRHLDTVADEAAAGVEAVEATIEGLQASLAERRRVAQEARAEADAYRDGSHPSLASPTSAQE